MLNQIIPVVPVLIVALSACAVLLAESFRRQGDWMPVGWLGIIGLTGAILTSVSLTVPVAGGRADLGTWQGIYLWEHRLRGHSRELVHHVLGEA